ARANTPEGLAAQLAPLASRSLLPVFPLGTDFDADEQRLIPALQWLKKSTATWTGKLALAAALGNEAPTEHEASALARMGFKPGGGLRELLLQRLVALALRRTR
ncbi:MAG TPA: hypothetical protein VL180_07500, partial [Burkholderiales bacterium]|nr:hypothetical protein [Burkholderiales bacterium]